MRFLIDAQLLRLARLLDAAGHDVVHTTELADGNRTSDRRICDLADAEGRVVVTKDRNFRDGHLLRGAPRRLLVVATGNTTNTALLSLFETHLETIIAAFKEADFVELGATALVQHQRRPGGGTPPHRSRT